MPSKNLVFLGFAGLRQDWVNLTRLMFLILIYYFVIKLFVFLKYYQLLILLYIFS